MASPKVQKRYSKPAKVVPKKDPAAAEAPPMPASDPAPEASPTSGTDGIPVGERHGAERTSMMERQTQELKDMHKRHMADLGSMNERHMAELGPGGAPAKKE